MIFPILGLNESFFFLFFFFSFYMFPYIFDLLNSSKATSQLIFTLGFSWIQVCMLNSLVLISYKRKIHVIMSIFKRNLQTLISTCKCENKHKLDVIMPTKTKIICTFKLLSPIFSL